MISKSIYFRAALVLALPFVLLLSCNKSQPSTSITTDGKSSLRQVLSITFNQFTPAISATVDNAGFWRIYTPNGTNLSHLVPTIVVSDKATVSPASGTVWDFTANYTANNPYNVLTFAVTAEDGEISTHSIQAF